MSRRQGARSAFNKMDKIVKVAFAIASGSRAAGGVFEAAKMLSAALKQTSQVVVSLYATRDDFLVADTPEWGGIEIHAPLYFGPPNFRFSPLMIWDLLRSDADLIHVHGVWTFHCLAVLIWSVLTGKPYLVSPHGMMEPWILARSPRLKRTVSLLYQNWFLRRASMFSCSNGERRARPRCRGGGFTICPHSKLRRPVLRRRRTPQLVERRLCRQDDLSFFRAHS